jgi:predicted ATPase/class 3 adenylate cyclase
VESELPRGSVTFVFTDIESSTRLLRRLEDAYVPLLERHRQLMRAAFGQYGGVEVKTDGDACFVAFPTAPGALAGCVGAQRALRAAPWPDGVAPLVRMGLHSGLAYPHDGDYIALAVHQAARVVDAAHGGQILASEQAVEAARAQCWPAGVNAADLGRYRLRDFDTPVRLFQIDEPWGARAFPALRAVPADHHNIVRARTSFVGRQRERAAITADLQPGAVVSIVGPGGTGKTRLATEIGVDVASTWADGVWLVDLSAVTDIHVVAPAVAAALGVPADTADRADGVLDHLEGRCCLLLFDNCEQVIAAVADLVSAIVARTASPGVLTTSREPLAVPAEIVHRLAPLPVSDDAVTLFFDRALRAGAGATRRPDPTDPVDRDVVVQICRRLDGLPLAIELAASRAAVLSLEEILAGLDERFRFLRSSDRGAPARQRTLGALLDWSYDLLAPDEQTAFERLSVFAGTFGIDAAEAALGHSSLDAYDVPELVWSLVDKSLVTVEPAANATRYRMLDTVRAYGAGRLAAADRAATAGALSAWYLERFPLGGRGQRGWLTGLALEIDTIAALIDTAAPNDATVAYLARLRGELRAVSGEPLAGRAEIDDVLARVTIPTPATARLVLFAATLAGDAGELDEALRRCADGEALLDRVGDVDRWGSVRVASPRPVLLLRSNDPDRLEEAEALAEASVEAAGNDADRADALLHLALVAGALARDGVAAIYSEIIDLAHRTGDHVLLALALNNVVEEELRRGDLALAARHQRDALAYAAELGMEHITTFGLIAAARIVEGQGSTALAVRLHAHAEARLTVSGLQLFPADQALSDAMLERARGLLGVARYDEERRAGAALTIAAALAEADAILGAASEEVSAGAGG